MILVGIAGTYTAVIVLGLDGATRVVLLVVAWALAVAGVAIRMLLAGRPVGLVALVYLVAGWQVLLDLPAYVAALTAAELSLLAVGGGLLQQSARIVYAPSPARTRGRPCSGTTRCSTPSSSRRARATGSPCSSWPADRRCCSGSASGRSSDRRGTVTLAFRRWRRPTVRAGGTLTTRSGVLAIDEVSAIDRARGHHRRPTRAGRLRGRRASARDDSPGRAGPAVPRSRSTSPGRIRASPCASRPTFDRRRRRPSRARLRRLDARAGGPWTSRVLRADRASAAGVRAGDLADALGAERLAFKADVRKLKALGLTESLGIGYRLSPRGRAWLDRQSLQRRLGRRVEAAVPAPAGAEQPRDGVGEALGRRRYRTSRPSRSATTSSGVGEQRAGA